MPCAGAGVEQMTADSCTLSSETACYRKCMYFVGECTQMSVLNYLVASHVSVDVVSYKYETFNEVHLVSNTCVVL